MCRPTWNTSFNSNNTYCLIILILLEIHTYFNFANADCLTILILIAFFFLVCLTILIIRVISFSLLTNHINHQRVLFFTFFFTNHINSWCVLFFFFLIDYDNSWINKIIFKLGLVLEMWITSMPIFKWALVMEKQDLVSPKPIETNKHLCEVFLLREACSNELKRQLSNSTLIMFDKWINFTTKVNFLWLERQVISLILFTTYPDLFIPRNASSNKH